MASAVEPAESVERVDRDSVGKPAEPVGREAVAVRIDLAESVGRGLAPARIELEGLSLVPRQMKPRLTKRTLRAATERYVCAA